MREAALRYGEFLLRQLSLAQHGRANINVNDVCDRFERLMANLPPAPMPLVWEGDYA